MTALMELEEAIKEGAQLDTHMEVRAHFTLRTPLYPILSCGHFSL